MFSQLFPSLVVDLEIVSVCSVQSSVSTVSLVGCWLEIVFFVVFCQLFPLLVGNIYFSCGV